MKLTLLSHSNDTTTVGTVQTVTPAQLKKKKNAGFGGFSTEDHYAECYPGYAPNSYIYYYHVFLYYYHVFLYFVVFLVSNYVSLITGVWKKWMLLLIVMMRPTL